jgi:hypothetical protein
MKVKRSAKGILAYAGNLLTLMHLFAFGYLHVLHVSVTRKGRFMLDNNHIAPNIQKAGKRHGAVGSSHHWLAFITITSLVQIGSGVKGFSAG